MRTILYALTALLSGFGAVSPQSNSLFSNGIPVPEVPQPSVQARYDKFASGPDLYTGAMTFRIPVFSYSDRDFNFSVALNYFSNGYKPNVQAGPLGLGWSLDAGGIITREVHGLPDDTNSTSDLYNFNVQNYGYDTDEYKPVAVYGYGYLHDVSKLPGLGLTSYNPETFPLQYVYQGKAGSEYMPVYTYYDPTDHVYTSDTVETAPDVFHFRMPGHSGSFVLEPGGGARFFGTEDYPAQYSLSLNLATSGFTSFTISDGLGYRYIFEEVETATSSNEHYSQNDVSSTSCWHLSRIESPSGRMVKYTYGNRCYSETAQKVAVREEYSNRMRLRDNTGNEITSSSSDCYTYTLSTSSDSGLLSSISVHDSATDPTATLRVLFSYSPRDTEQGCSNNTTYQLDSINVLNIDGRAVKSCQLEYDTEMITFLSAANISGEGKYGFGYLDADASFPGIGSWQTDWYGFWNSNVTQQTFAPAGWPTASETASRSWLQSLRQANADCASAGMLSRIEWPAGGYTTIGYEGNRAGTSTASGVRVCSMSTFDSNEEEEQRRTFSYCDGILLWRPELYCDYDLTTSGFQNIHRKIFSTLCDFPYSGKNFIEYPEVLETIMDPKDSSRKCIVKHLFYSANAGLYASGGSRDSYGTACSSMSLSGGLWYCQSVSGFSGILYDDINCWCQNSFAGRPLSEEEYSDNLDSPVKKSVRITEETGDAISYTEMLLGAWSNRSVPTTTRRICKVDVMEYDSAHTGQVIDSLSITYGYDTSGRMSSESFICSNGDVHTKSFSYHSVLPSLVTGIETKVGNTTIAGERYDYRRKELLDWDESDWRYFDESDFTFPLWYVPYRKLSAEMNSDGTVSYSTDMTFRDYNRWGNPQKMVDRAGTVSEWRWGYGGLHPVSLSQGSETTTWTWVPLVGLKNATAPTGELREYDYDSAGRLVKTSQNGVVTMEAAYNVVND